MTRRLVAAVVAALASWPSVSAASVADDAARLAEAWTTRGHRVTRLLPVFVEHGRPVAIEPRASRAPGACAAIVALGVRAADFTLRPIDPNARGEELEEPPPGRDAPGQSAHGLAALARCGASRAEIDHVLLSMRASRGAVELVLVTTDEAPAVIPPEGPSIRDIVQDPTEILPERAIGLLAGRGDAGRPIEPGPIAERLARAERRARQDGAVQLSSVRMRASPRGDGIFSLRLSDGCHRIEVMAEVPRTLPRHATDVDVEAREVPTGRLLARDRGEAPDARVQLCLGEPSVVEVAFGGAAGAVGVTAATARWPIPAMAPKRWGPRGRAAFAAALMRRNAPLVENASPVYESLGVAGTTTLGVPVDPGRCYVAALGVIRGDARGLRLTASAGDRTHRDEGLDRTDGAAVTFCSDTDAARLDVEVRGASPWWALAVWPLP